MNAERLALSAMAFGLLLIIQPWTHAGFVAGFPITLLSILAYNFVARRPSEDP